VLLELIEMPGDLAVQLLGHDADAAEQRPEHVELLREQLDPLLQQIVIFHQQFDLLFGLARSHLRLLAAFPHSYVVPLPSPPVLVARLVDSLALLPADVGSRVMLMGHHRALHRSASWRRLMDRCAGMAARYRGRRKGGEGRCAVGEWTVRHRTVAGGRVLRAVTPIVRWIEWFLLDAGRLRARAVAVAAAVAALMITRAAVHRLRHIGQRRTWITAGSDMFDGTIVRTEHVQEAIVEMIIIDQMLEVQRDLRCVEIGKFARGSAMFGVLLVQACLAGGHLAHHRAVLLLLAMVVVDLQRGIVVVRRGIIVLIAGIVIEHLGLLQVGRTLHLGLMCRRVVHDW